jgi:hypothetical protein
MLDNYPIEKRGHLIMRDNPSLYDVNGSPFEVIYHGNDHAIVIGKISQGKTFNTNQLLNVVKTSRTISSKDAPEFFVKPKKS